MSYRSELRNACYRAQKGKPRDSQKHLLDLIEPLLTGKQKWENFTQEWDILLDKNGNINVIKPEVDDQYINHTCAEAKVLAKNNLKFELNDRQQNIIDVLELSMLDGIMTWENYGEVWTFDIDRTSNVLRTKLIPGKPIQTEVTEEMIKASMKNADGSAFTRPEDKEDYQNTVLDMKPIEDLEEIKKLDGFFKNKKKK